MIFPVSLIEYQRNGRNQLGRSFGAQGLSRWHCCRCRQAPHSARTARKKCPGTVRTLLTLHRRPSFSPHSWPRIIERTEEGVPAIKEGVAKDRIVSVLDPEERHGRKSKSGRFDGHKAAIAVDVKSQLNYRLDQIECSDLIRDCLAGKEFDVGNELGFHIDGDCRLVTIERRSCSCARAFLRIKDLKQSGLWQRPL